MAARPAACGDALCDSAAGRASIKHNVGGLYAVVPFSSEARPARLRQAARCRTALRFVAPSPFACFRCPPRPGVVMQNHTFP
ncbi:hypothetical protein LU632_03950 [Erwinia tracheiphila]|uniref:hypothetical protein n=1 Tax=Erwinia tracheiphila TaxID=65700 RepID=UPI001F25A931|nr:hypothetical protein [Erwinia tracheiphila]UIA92817.1 hypothetical protein LU632_03950 [Erwinia tracheiphila]